MNRTAVEQERLHAYLTATRLDQVPFAPGFVERIGERKLGAIRSEIRHECGAVRTITTQPGTPGSFRVECRRGVLHAEIRVDEHGRITLLKLEYALDDRPRSAAQRMVHLLQLARSLALVPALQLSCAISAVLAGTCAEVLPLLVTSAAALVIGWLTVPWAWTTHHARPLLAGATLVLLGIGATRLRTLPPGHLSWANVGMAAVVAVNCMVIVAGSREARTERPALLIADPLPGNRSVVGHGGGRTLNHHAGHPEQSYALDVLCLGPLGSRARGLAPLQPAAYHAYGAPLAAPCAGTVIAAVDGHLDQPVQASPFQARPLGPQPAYGNHIVLRSATDPEVVLVLAHLRAGSLRVAEGHHVTSGQLVAEVGNSGNTSEPHLHLHAEARTADSVSPVPLRLAARPRRPLLRGRRLDG